MKKINWSEQSFTGLGPKEMVLIVRTIILSTYFKSFIFTSINMFLVLSFPRRYKCGVLRP